MARELPEVVNTYLTEKTNFIARYQLRNSGITKSSDGGPMAFASLVDGHALGLAANLPPLSPSQWEGLAELTASYCAHLRMLEHKGDPS